MLHGATFAHARPDSLDPVDNRKHALLTREEGTIAHDLSIDHSRARQHIADRHGRRIGTAHTQAHFQDAFFMSELFDNNSFEQWLADGAKDADARGLEAARKALDGYVAPALESGVEEALAEFIARRERELPDKQD